METTLYRPLFVTYVVEHDGELTVDYIGSDQQTAYTAAHDRTADGFETRIGRVTFEACFTPKEPE